MLNGLPPKGNWTHKASPALRGRQDKCETDHSMRPESKTHAHRQTCRGINKQTNILSTLCVSVRHIDFHWRSTFWKRKCVLQGSGLCRLTRNPTFLLFVVTAALFRHYLSMPVIRWQLSLASIFSLCFKLMNRIRTSNCFDRYCNYFFCICLPPPVVFRTTFPQSPSHSRVQCVDRRPFCRRKGFLLCKTTSSSQISWRFES